MTLGSGQRPTPESIAAHLMEAAPDAMIVVTASGIIALFNRQAETMFGYAREEIVGQNVERLIPPRFRERHRVALAGYFSHPHVRQMGSGLDLSALRKDGAEFPVDIRLSPLRAQGQDFTTAVVREISPERQQAAVGEWLAAIVASSDDAIIGKSLDGVITSWNAGAERIFGYTAKEAIGKPITMLMPPDVLPEEHEILSRVSAGERVEHYDTKRRRKDGAIIDVSLTVSPIRGSDGAVIGASKIARDITLQKRAEEAMRAHSMSRPIVIGMVRELLHQAYIPARGLAQLGRNLAGELPRKSIDEYLEAFALVGLGSLSRQGAEAGRYVFQGRDLIERTAHATQPTCLLTLGFLEGAIQAVEGSRALGAEMRCQSLGHEACVFVVHARAG